ncbi:MAG TPA: SoxR reducing system RseC family protein [Bacteroidales bacterium]|nr:SoxR reducing system RseC family protein [Bacteroidales bacterium]
MIEHEGIIEKVKGNNITVRILQKSACSDCHARAACMASDSKEKLVDIRDYTGMYQENESVIIEGKKSIGYKAVFWAFVLPLLFLILVLVLSLTLWNLSDTKAALASLVALIPYYCVLYFFRNRMANSFRFSIKKTN